MHKLHSIAALTDNYIWILENENKQAVIIDPAEAEPVITYLTKQQITPVAILLTHHHHDHIGGVPMLQIHYSGIPVYGPDEIPLPIKPVTAKDHIAIKDFNFDIIDVKGHTLGHLAYYCKPYLFCGDTLFSAGCGRIFEGSFEQMFESLNKLKTLPDDTQICAGHEYTHSNLHFAHQILPDDQGVANHLNLINKKQITLPSRLAIEKKINLFLRCNEKKLQIKFNVSNEFELFVFLRKQKDIF